jgi:vacuolar protein sorting-associated protein 13A/C
MGILDPQGTHLIKVYKIVPGESQPAPVEAAYHQAVVIRPDAGFGYTWSGERLFWRDLLKGPTKGITCKSEEENAPPFYFQMHAKYQKENASARQVIHGYPEFGCLLPSKFKICCHTTSSSVSMTRTAKKNGQIFFERVG